MKESFLFIFIFIKKALGYYNFWGSHHCEIRITKLIDTKKFSTLALFSRSKDTSFVNMAAGANEDVRNFSYSFFFIFVRTVFVRF